MLFYACCILLFFDYSAFYYVFLYIKEYFTYGTKYGSRTIFVTICYILIFSLLIDLFDYTNFISP